MGLQGFLGPRPRKVHLSTTFGGRSHLIAWLCSSLSSFGFIKVTFEPFQGAFGHLVIWINVFPMIIAPRRISRTPPTEQLSDLQKASKIKHCTAVQMLVDTVCQVNSSFIVLPHPSNPMVGERKQKCSLGWSGASGACQFHPRGLGWWPGGEVYSRQFASPSGWTRYLLQIGWGSGTVLGWKSCFWARLAHITDQMCSRILAWNVG